jgi:hypothetical protein
MTFTTTRLVGNRVLVGGSDVFGNKGQAILDSTQWDEVNADKAYDQAAEAFDAAVEEFFAPLVQASETLAKTLERPADPASYVVLREAVEGQAPQPEQLVKLTHDSIVLRLIEQNRGTGRVIWVGDDQLEILEADTPLPAFDGPAGDPAFDGVLTDGVPTVGA